MCRVGADGTVGQSVSAQGPKHQETQVSFLNGL